MTSPRFLRALTRRCACALAALSVALVANGQDAQEQTLDDVSNELTRAVFRRRPWLAAERGWEEVGLGVGRYGFADRAWWIHTIEDLEDALDDMRHVDLTPEQTARFHALAGATSVERIQHESRSQERWSAESFVRRIQLILGGRISSPPYSPTAQAEVLHVLDELPGYWKSARQSLVSPVEAWTREGMIELDQLEHFLSARRDEFANGFDDEARAEVGVRFDAAIADIAAFREWLEDAPTGIGGSEVRVEARRWEAMVRAATGTEWTTEEIKVRLTRDLARAERDYGPRWRDAGAVVTNGSVFDTNALVSLSMRALELARSVLDLPALDADITLRFEPLETPLCIGNETSGLDGNIETIHLDPSLLLRDDFGTRAALALRYGYPGEAFFRNQARAAEDPFARYLWGVGAAEGFGLYALDWIQRIDAPDNVFRDDRTFAAEAARQRLVEGARLLAALEFHAQGLSTDEVAEGLRRRTGLDLERALQEAHNVVSDPLLGVGYLVWAELRLFEDALGEEEDAHGAIGRTLRATLSTTGLRPVDRKLLSARAQ